MPLEHAQHQLEGNIDLSATGVHAGTFCPAHPGRITEVGLTMLTNITASGAVKFKYRPTAGSATGEVDIATLNIGTGDAQGSQVIKDLNTLRYNFVPGSEIIAEVADLTAASESCKGYIWYDFSGWENASNLTNKRETM